MKHQLRVLSHRLSGQQVLPVISRRTRLLWHRLCLDTTYKAVRRKPIRSPHSISAAAAITWQWRHRAATNTSVTMRASLSWLAGNKMTDDTRSCVGILTRKLPRTNLQCASFQRNCSYTNIKFSNNVPPLKWTLLSYLIKTFSFMQQDSIHVSLLLRLSPPGCVPQ